MTIDEAISHALEVAEQEEKNSKTGKWFEGEDWNIKAREQCAECATDHRQLAEWLTELKDLREENKVLTSECDRLIKEKGELLKKSEQIAECKRLLKAAMEDIVWLNEHTVDGEGRCLIETATDMETCLACPLNVNNSHICGWKHQVDALKLIGEDEDENS